MTLRFFVMLVLAGLILALWGLALIQGGGPADDLIELDGWSKTNLAILSYLAIGAALLSPSRDVTLLVIGTIGTCMALWAGPAFLPILAFFCFSAWRRGGLHDICPEASEPRQVGKVSGGLEGGDDGA